MRLSLFALFAVIAAPALAADPVATPPTKIYRLALADRDAVIAAAALQPERAGSALLPPPAAPANALAPSAERDSILGNSLYADIAPDRRPHGEIGMFVGSGGSRGIFGTVGMPLGDNGFASFSFDTGRYPLLSAPPYRLRNAPRR
jgi:hypothetical protein